MVLLASFLVGSVLAAAVAARPAPAQPAGGGVPPDYVPPEVVLEEDGTPPDFLLDEDAGVIIDGDGVTDCRSFAAALEEGFLGGNRGQAQSVLEQCRRGGFLPSGGSAPENPVVENGEIRIGYDVFIGCRSDYRALGEEYARACDEAGFTPLNYPGDDGPFPETPGALPDTGGAAPVLLGTGALLATAGFLIRRIWV